MLLFEQIYHLDQHVNLENKEKKLIATKGYIYNVKNINFIHISFLSSPFFIWKFITPASHDCHLILK